MTCCMPRGRRGEKGDQGDPGPAGEPGIGNSTGIASFEGGPGIQLSEVSGSDETSLIQVIPDFDALESLYEQFRALVSGGPVTLTAGPATSVTVRLRIGGTDGGIDGTVVASATFTVTGVTTNYTSGFGAPFTRPVGPEFVKITYQVANPASTVEFVTPTYAIVRVIP